MAADHHHHDGHDHGGRDHGGHSHAHHHHHSPLNYDRAFAVGTALNLVYAATEMGYGFLANSVALIADATHNFSDVAALLLAWAAAWLTRRAPTSRRSYGWGRFSILAALANGLLLMLAVGAIALEAIQRLRAPEPVAETTVLWVASLGVAINFATALLFLRDRQHDLNIRATFLHMMADTAVSGGVVIGALVVGWTGWLWLDPVISLAIAAVITLGTWDLLRQAMSLALDAVPAAIAPEQVQARLAALPGVTEVHDLHIWGLSTTETALTVHLVHDGPPDPSLLRAATDLVAADFAIRHATFQIETPAQADACHLRPDGVI